MLKRYANVAFIAAIAALGFTAALPESGDDAAVDTSRSKPGKHENLGPGRPGANANAPTEIPARGWWQVAKRVFNGINEDRVLAEAAGVTFYTLLAVFPAIASLISIYGLVADPATIGKHLSGIAGVVPQGGMQIISEQVKSLTSSPSKALGLGVVIGILTSLWSANAGIKALMDAMNSVYEEKEQRSFLRRTLISFCFTLGMLGFVILALAAVVVVPAVLNSVGLGATGDALLNFARWPLLLITVGLLLSLLYRFGPSRPKARWRWITWGSALASLVWVLASAGFSWYVANFGSYNKTYGSLGAAVGFMTWIWISAIVVLTGGELNAELEKQTDRDTTDPHAA